jgi:hypothetical protein
VEPGKDEQRLWKCPEWNSGIMEQGLRQQANKGPRQQTATISEEGEDTCEQHQKVLRKRSHLGSGGTLKKALYKTFRRKKAKQIAGLYIASRRIKNWTLWRDWHPPKRLKSLLHV